MVVIKAKFDGQRVILPETMQGVAPGEVILVFEEADGSAESNAWLLAQQDLLSKAWDNDEDAVYDAM